MLRNRAVWLFLVTCLLSVLACGGANEATPVPPTSPPPTAERSGGERGEGVSTATVVAAVDTVVPASPTPPPAFTPTPVPTVTPDPNLADWTILVYLAADNDLELQGLLDINEMETAGRSSKVNVVLQVDRTPGETTVSGDWTDTRRYLVQGDKDPDSINPTLLEELGEQNMGDPNVLTDFIVWGMEGFPANHYALILWDHGAGWLGVAFDESTSGYDELSMNDLDGALQRALAQVGPDHLDIIGFDACLMGQMEVYDVVSPYALYAVGSEELVPGLGWDYAALLSDLYAAPEMDAGTLAQHMVDDFLAYYTDVEPDKYVTMSAVRLDAMPRVTDAVEQLAAALIIDPALSASAVGDARAGAESFARFYPEDADYYAAVDLWHFASILAQRSTDEAVTAAAQEVMAAVADAVVAEAHGGGLPQARGMAVYFPRLAEFMEPSYASEGPVAGWDTFLSTYHDLGLADIPEPGFDIVNVLSDVAGYQQPAYMDVEITGRDIENVYLIAGIYQPDGRLQLVEYDYLIPEPTYLDDGSLLYEWHDGVHEDFFVWYTDASYITDGQNGDYVVMWPTDYDSSLYVVEGRYRPAGESKYFDASLVFDTDTGEMDSVWGVQSSGEGAPYEIFPARWDEFQIYDQYLTEDGDTIREAGVSLFFAENKQLYYQWRPLPSGDYFLGFAAETIAGQWAEVYHDFAVDNDNLIPGYATYLDPYQGFQFNYPEAWYRPEYDDALLYTSNPDATTYLYITLYPDLGSGTPADLKTQTLDDFGAVDILYEDVTTVDGEDGLITAYGYNDADGVTHTGVFFTFAREGVGYVVDLDGPLSEEEANLEAAVEIIGSWVFQPVGFGLYPGNWATLTLDGFTVSKPEEFTYEELENGWQLFTGETSDTFVALRTDPDSGAGRLPLLADWLAVAGDGVEGFATGDPYRFTLADNLWVRGDFDYVNEDGLLIRGFIMVTLRDGQEIVAWAEAPANAFPDLENQVFLVIISDLTLPGD